MWPRKRHEIGYLGEGTFAGADRIEVAGHALEFKRAVIATGSRAAAPSIPGLDQCEYLTNESVFSLTELPKRLAVIGAGPIGSEMAQAFARFGSNICSSYQFTHAADFMARIVIQNALFMGRAKVTSLVIPWCTYTQPEVAHVGIYQKEAQKKGIELDTFTQLLDGVDRAILDGETEGFARVHVKKGTDQILGATIVATQAGDMISQVAMAMTHRLGLKKIAATIFPYPTQAEAIRKTGDAYNRTRLTPFIKRLFAWWLSRSR
ncbi:MAG: FAD-dependent oxidoreductase [Terrimicrobiaceae bacterium]